MYIKKLLRQLFIKTGWDSPHIVFPGIGRNQGRFPRAKAMDLE